MPKGTPKPKLPELDAEALLASVEAALGISASDICCPGKAPHIMHGKETFILCGQRLGANMAELARFTGLNISTITRRFEKAKTSFKDNESCQKLIERVLEAYESRRIAISQV